MRKNIVIPAYEYNRKESMEALIAKFLKAIQELYEAKKQNRTDLLVSGSRLLYKLAEELNQEYAKNYGNYMDQVIKLEHVTLRDVEELSKQVEIDMMSEQPNYSLLLENLRPTYSEIEGEFKLLDSRELHDFKESLSYFLLCGKRSGKTLGDFKNRLDNFRIMLKVEEIEHIPSCELVELISAHYELVCSNFARVHRSYHCYLGTLNVATSKN